MTVQLPQTIADEMNKWRALNMEVPLPQSFITFHARLADQDLEFHTNNLHDDGMRWVVIVDEGFDFDSFGMDGMKLRTVIIAVKEDGKWVIKRIRWHESGAWFVQGAGWSRYAEMRPLTNEVCLALEEQAPTTPSLVID